MKNNNFKILAMLFLAAFSSCSSDDSGNSNGTTTGDYYPMAVNNKWDYTDGSAASEINLIGTAVFGGTTYYEMTDSDSGVGAQVWMTKKGATYYQKSGEATITQAGTTIAIQGFEVPLFKDDLAVNETWHGTVKPKVNYSGPSGSGSFNLIINYSGVILERDATVTLGGITYNNVIKMGMNLTETANSQTTTITGENWFAKDIGLIYDSTTSSTDNITKIRTLTSYELH